MKLALIVFAAALVAAPAIADPPKFVAEVRYSADQDQLTADIAQLIDRECGDRVDYAIGVGAGFTNPKQAKADCLADLKLKGKQPAEVRAAFQRALAAAKAAG